MATNYPGPYELRFHYDTQLTFGEHVQRLSLDLSVDASPGDPFTGLSAQTRGGVDIELEQAVEDWIALIAPLYSTTVDFPLVELWKYAPGTFDATFIAAYDPTNDNGTAGVAPVAGGQVVMTFRTIEGGILKATFMETSLAAGPSQSFPTTVGAVNDVSEFIVSPDNWILARDTSYPIAPRAYFPGQNEALWKKYNR